ncbi:ComEC/Rec2 family competence protein [Nonomuraea fuscirosea]|uniref:ComEC/Rec2 family competence protein n=1 Tax=Nonomuraea fuscirosea TaxID=1291556 RepID=UPI00341C75C2
MPRKRTADSSKDPISVPRERTWPLAVPALAAWASALVLPACSALTGMIVAITAALATIVVLRLIQSADGQTDSSTARRTAWRNVALATLICTAAASASVAFRVHALTTGPAAQLAEANAFVTAQIALTDDPKRRPDRSGHFQHASYVISADLITIRTATTTQAVNVPITVFATGQSWGPLLPTQHVEVTGRLAKPVPGSLIAATLLVRGPPRVLTQPSGLQTAAGALRSGLRSAADILPPDQRGLLPGLVVGDVSRMDPQVTADFKEAGLSHLNAVSGANLAIVAGATLALSRLIGLSLPLRALFAAVAMLAFAVVARPSPSVLRALLMGLAAAIAMGTGRSKDGFAALSATVLFLILFAPDLARSYGFALSVTATAGILILAPRWRDKLTGANTEATPPETHPHPGDPHPGDSRPGDSRPDRAHPDHPDRVHSDCDGLGRVHSDCDDRGCDHSDSEHPGCEHPGREPLDRDRADRDRPHRDRAECDCPHRCSAGPFALDRPSLHHPNSGYAKVDNLETDQCDADHFSLSHPRPDHSQSGHFGSAQFDPGPPSPEHRILDPSRSHWASRDTDRLHIDTFDLTRMTAGLHARPRSSQAVQDGPSRAVQLPGDARGDEVARLQDADARSTDRLDPAARVNADRFGPDDSKPHRLGPEQHHGPSSLHSDPHGAEPSSRSADSGSSWRVPRWMAEAVAVPAAAQLAVTPVLVLMAGQLTPVAVIANLLVAPAVAPATLLGFGAALVAPVWPDGARLLVIPAGYAVGWIITVARWAVNLPFANVPWPAGLAGLGLLLLVMTVTVLILRRRAWRAIGLTATGAALVTVLVIRPIAGPWPPRNWLMVMCDVGQGDGLVISAGPGRGVVVDTGPDPVTMDRCLRRIGIEDVPLLVLTHPHADHVNGLPGVLRNRRVGAVLVSPQRTDARSGARVSATLAHHRIPEWTAPPGTRWRFGPSELTVLAPEVAADDLHGYGEGSAINNSSVVMHVRWRAGSILLSGDLETEAQEHLHHRLTVRADLLKTPHHGSNRQSPAFLSSLGARAALISVGADNDYGHPAVSTLNLLRRLGLTIYRTDKEGDLAVVEREEGGLAIVSRGT